MVSPSTWRSISKIRCAWHPRVPKCKSDRNRVLYRWVSWDLGTRGLLARGRTTRNDCADSHVASMTRRTRWLIVLSLKSVESRGLQWTWGSQAGKRLFARRGKAWGALVRERWRKPDARLCLTDGTRRS